MFQITVSDTQFLLKIFMWTNKKVTKLLVLFSLFGCMACGTSAPWPGIKPTPPALEEVFFCFFNIYFYLSIYLAVPSLSYNMQTLACGMWDLVPQPDIEPSRPALGVQNLSRWTTREFPSRRSLNHWISREIPDIEFLCRKILKLNLKKKNFF